ncbi:Carnitine O-acetyltransferase [Halotydeus destructor]|nr:Carnitine O-acetyltransferase [Halotydeus destructor]
MLRLSRSLLTKNVSGQVKKITQPVASLLDEVRVNSVPTNGLSTQTATILDSAPSVLPMLPVPNLLESMERLKRATGPFAVRQKEFVEFINLVDQFASGSGIKLHQLLVNKSKQTNNWLSHDWFINKNYLQNPDPVMIWTNTALVFPKGDSGSHSLDSVANHISRTICGLLDFRDQLKLGNFPEKDLCSDQYKKIFGSSRIPGISMDAIRVGDLSLEANSIVISRNNKFYEVTLPERPELLAAVLQNAIITILTESKDVASSLPVGSLTSLPRDDWANIYPRLEPNATNAIVESQFVVCLDHISGQNLANFETDYHATIAKQVLHADQDNIGNRWHDKSVQLVFALSP